MMMTSSKRSAMRSPLRVFLLWLAAMIAGAAQAETTVCKEIVPPVAITQPGVYCLFKDYALNIPGAAIDVQANNVVIDLNGHRLGNGSAGPATVSVGVNSRNMLNTSVRNGTILGFGYGIVLSGETGSGHLVEDMLIDRNTLRGVYVSGKRSVIRRNRITNTGLGATHAPELPRVGVEVTGSDVVLLNNDINRVVSAGAAFGIYATDGGSILARDNTISGLDAARNYRDYGIAINVKDSTTRVSVAVQNTIVDGTKEPGQVGRAYGVAVGGDTSRVFTGDILNDVVVKTATF